MLVNKVIHISVRVLLPHKIISKLVVVNDLNYIDFANRLFYSSIFLCEINLDEADIS